MKELPKDFPLVTYKAIGQYTKIGTIQIVLRNGQKTEKSIRAITMGVFAGEEKLHDVETVVVPLGKML